jgi:hypothetical protein
MTLPAHLTGTQARGLVENEPIAQFEIGPARSSSAPSAPTRDRLLTAPRP